MPAFTPKDVHILFERAFNSGDLEAIVALYEPGAILVSGGRQIAGVDSIRHAFEGFLAGGAFMKLETRSAIESGEGLALLHGAWSLGPPRNTHGLSTEVVRRQPDGSWRFVIDIPHTPL